MNKVPGTLLHKWSLAGLFVLLVTAWFSVGYYHADEHFQILEFCNYKLGFSPSSSLAWEFNAQCRPGLQPLIAWCVSKMMLGINAYDPFFVAFILRAAIAVLTWYTIRRTISTFIDEFKTEEGKKLFALSNYFLWFVPYIGVRFSSENISASLFVLAITLLVNRQKGKTGVGGILLAGLLLGLSLFLRLQLGFAVIGIAIWLLKERFRFTDYIWLILAGLMGIGVGTLTDYWLYGHWVFSPYNYFDVNIIQKVAAKFGETPWWNYFVMFFELGIPPISVLLLVSFFAGGAKRTGHVFFLSIVTFLLGHFAIGHKEMRFLFPAVIPFIYLCCSGMEAWYIKLKSNRAGKIAIRLLLTLNLAVLVFKMFTPAEEVMKYHSFLYHYSQKHDPVLLSVNHSSFWMDDIENFYKPSFAKFASCTDSSQIGTVVRDNPGREILYMSRNLIPSGKFAEYKVELVYSQFPDWALKYDINQWQERSYIWAVYRISK